MSDTRPPSNDVSSGDEVSPEAQPEREEGGEAGGRQEAREGGRSREQWIALFLEVAVLFMIALVLALYLQAFMVKPFMIPSPSMEPTLQEGDRVLADRVTYRFREPRRGEIVVFRFPPDDPANWTNEDNFITTALDLLAEVLNVTHQGGHPPFIKRVVGIGGDTVEMRDGVLYLNGDVEEVDYEYFKDESNGKWEVPEGSVMVMGDNRSNSNDSRRWGFVPYEAILGRAVLIWWPPSRWSTL